LSHDFCCCSRRRSRRSHGVPICSQNVRWSCSPESSSGKGVPWRARTGRRGEGQICDACAGARARARSPLSQCKK
jgi:hypothetical protein